jgi:hypothetical protein
MYLDDGPGCRYLPRTAVPGYGWTVVALADLSDPAEWQADHRETVETDRYTITFDTERGGIRSWYHSATDCELVDQAAADSLGRFVYERLDTDRANPRRAFFERDDPLAILWGGLYNPPRGWKPEWRHAHRCELCQDP